MFLAKALRGKDILSNNFFTGRALIYVVADEIFRAESAARYKQHQAAPRQSAEYFLSVTCNFTTGGETEKLTKSRKKYYYY